LLVLVPAAAAMTGHSGLLEWRFRAIVRLAGERAASWRSLVELTAGTTRRLVAMAVGMGSRRMVIGVGALVGALACTGTAAAITVASSAGPGVQNLVVGAQPGEVGTVSGVPLVADTAPIEPPDWVPPPPPVPTTATPATTTAPPVTSVVPRTTTTLGTTSTTGTTVRAVTPVRPSTPPMAAMSPTSGPAGTQVRIHGDGCVGDQMGFALTLKDPSGQGFDGDGGSTMPDGTWSIDIPMSPTLTPGRYTVNPECRSTISGRIFEYSPLAFTVTA